MEKNKSLIFIFLQCLIISGCCFWLHRYPLTKYGGLKEIQVKYYLYPVVVVACITLCLSILHFFHIIIVRIGRSRLIALTVLVLIAVAYIILVNSQIGPFEFLPVIDNSYEIYAKVTQGMQSEKGTIFLSIYGIVTYIAISTKDF